MSPGRQDSPLQCVQGSDTAQNFAIVKVSGSEDTMRFEYLLPTNPQCPQPAQGARPDTPEAPHVGWQTRVQLPGVPLQQPACRSIHTAHFPV